MRRIGFVVMLLLVFATLATATPDHKWGTKIRIDENICGNTAVQNRQEQAVVPR